MRLLSLAFVAFLSAAGVHAEEPPCAQSLADLVAPPSGLERLRAEIAVEEGEDYGHRLYEVTDRPGSWGLKIDYLDRKQNRLMRLVMLAVREGDLVEIDTGGIIGAKVLFLLRDIVALPLARERKLVLKGSLDPDLMTDLAKEIRQSQMRRSRGDIPRNAAADPRYWTEAEVQEFWQAARHFGWEGKFREEPFPGFSFRLEAGQTH